MDRYCVNIYRNNSWESIALFEDTVSLDAMIAFAEVQFENGNSLTLPCENIAVIDMTTGEVMWDWDSDNEEYYPDDWYDDVDESNYDPYAGCDMYEPCDFDGGW